MPLAPPDMGVRIALHISANLSAASRSVAKISFATECKNWQVTGFAKKKLFRLKMLGSLFTQHAIQLSLILLVNTAQALDNESNLSLSS
jgi:hypothetical protein